MNITWSVVNRLLKQYGNRDLRDTWPWIVWQINFPFVVVLSIRKSFIRRKTLFSKPKWIFISFKQFVLENTLYFLLSCNDFGNEVRYQYCLCLLLELNPKSQRCDQAVNDMIYCIILISRVNFSCSMLWTTCLGYIQWGERKDRMRSYESLIPSFFNIFWIYTPVKVEASLQLNTA